jgi:DNA-binding MarR family transcriptional regulator
MESPVQPTHHANLIIPLLQGFEWFDDGLQRSLSARGWPDLTRPESMIMIHVLLEMRRPPDIARSLGLTRQAIHRTIGNIVDKGLFSLGPDPSDKRGTVIVLTAQGEAMRKDAQHIVELMDLELSQRLGGSKIAGLVSALAAEWGPVPAYGPDDRLLD